MTLTKISILIGLALSVGVTNANAGFFDDIKNKVKSVSKKEVKDKSASTSTSNLASPSLAGGPDESLTSMTSCTDFKPEI